MKDLFISIFGSIIFGFIFLFILFYVTSADYWYVGMHDSHCEGKNCHCYERLTNK